MNECRMCGDGTLGRCSHGNPLCGRKSCHFAHALMSAPMLRAAQLYGLTRVYPSTTNAQKRPVLH